MWRHWQVKVTLACKLSILPLIAALTIITSCYTQYNLVYKSIPNVLCMNTIIKYVLYSLYLCLKCVQGRFALHQWTADWMCVGLAGQTSYTRSLFSVLTQFQSCQSACFAVRQRGCSCCFNAILTPYERLCMCFVLALIYSVISLMGRLAAWVLRVL